MKTVTATLPAGRYSVGDPFYALQHKWSEVCKILNAAGDASLVEIDGNSCFFVGCGDNSYWCPGLNCSKYVMTGTMLIMPTSMIQGHINGKYDLVLDHESEVSYDGFNIVVNGSVLVQINRPYTGYSSSKFFNY